MFDLKISGGLVVDGTGNSGQVMDVGIIGDRIVAVGNLAEPAAEEIDATGRIVIPGFVDIHTHYDGQATWDQEMAPSSWHGVTTVVMGNCGVGFAPAAPDRQEWLVGLMEGVEDIPGSALTEGMTWNWESFPEYLDALEAWTVPLTWRLRCLTEQSVPTSWVIEAPPTRRPQTLRSRACRQL